MSVASKTSQFVIDKGKDLIQAPVSKIIRNKIAPKLVGPAEELAKQASNKHLTHLIRKSDGLATAIGKPKVDTSGMTAFNNIMPTKAMTGIDSFPPMAGIKYTPLSVPANSKKLSSHVTNDILNQRHGAGYGLISNSMDEPGVHKLLSKETDPNGYFDKFTNIYKNAPNSQVYSAAFPNAKNVINTVDERAAKMANIVSQKKLNRIMNRIENIERGAYVVGGTGVAAGGVMAMNNSPNDKSSTILSAINSEIQGQSAPNQMKLLQSAFAKCVTDECKNIINNKMKSIKNIPV